MEKRLTLALVLSLAFTLLYVQLFTPRPAPRPVPDSGAAAKGEVAEAGPEKEATPSEEKTLPPAEQLPHTDVPLEDEIVVELDLLKVRLTNSGASVRDLWLKDYFVRPGIDPASSDAQNPENWLRIYYEMEIGKRLAAFWEVVALDAPLPFRLDEVPWELVGEVVPPEETAAAEVLRRKFRFSDGMGIVYTKEFVFYRSERFFDVNVGLENAGLSEQKLRDYRIRAGAGILKEGEAAFSTGPSATGAFVSEGDVSVETVEGAKLFGSPRSLSGELPRRIVWGGCTNNYFGVLMSPNQPGQITQLTLHSLIDSQRLEQLRSSFLERQGRAPRESELAQLEEEASVNAGCQAAFSILIPSIGSREERSFRIFAGPKAPELVAEAPYDIYEPLVAENYGSTLAWINIALLETMRFFHRLVGNWGVAIILLTVLVRGLIYPLQRLQSKSMEKYQKTMMRLKPKLDELKKRYKNNQRKFQEAQMKLMREEGIRPPLFGCLIMLLPLPVFIGLFQILRTAIELRHAPFTLWIDDLSQPDHLVHLPFSIPLLGEWLNLLPLLMLATWIAQNMAMPKPTDPQQIQMQKMMKFMPFIFLFLLYNYASGLSLYMTVSSLLGIVQYKYLRITTPTT
ncbi:MAG: membrane protein insertase YidC [Planctomycetota bacterium]